ncbi:CYTH domain-containing protein [Atopobacter sp. AH10]|uniref:CYTH domain-containing protein n=1 Tax=Atopobacter sp. AH10 TaxID=2315861 RepID=UPI0013148304|nr:CYTH domain-containing protein [Atopobacter sp. AH10]
MTEQSVEKEFKCLLSEKAYQEGLKLWMTGLSPIYLQNVYYDWQGILSQADKALRIRMVNQEIAELTLKESLGPNEKRETTLPLDAQEAKAIIDKKQLRLPSELRQYLHQQGIDLAELQEKVSFTTCRYEKECPEALIVLDEVHYSNGARDLELECEVNDLIKGKAYFQHLLKDLDTDYQAAPNKLARAIHYKAKN